MKEHLPVMNEALRLNTFARGLSLGEFGGINRPLMNLFLPQSWESSEERSATLKRFVPIVRDAQRILEEGSEQSRIVNQSRINGLAALKDEPTSTLNRRPSTKTEVAQRIEAAQYRRDLFDAFKDVLDYNDSAPDDDAKYHFGGAAVPEDMQGEVIDRANIQVLIKKAFPLYDRKNGVAFGMERDDWATEWLRKRKGTPEYEKYAEFYEKAKTAISHLNKDRYPPEQAIQVTSLFRDTAIEYASTDRDFYRWYNKTFKNSGFGPLEAQT